MSSRWIVSVILSLFFAGKLCAQNELGAWEFTQELSLTQAMRSDPDLVVRFAGGFLLVAHPNLISGAEACGSVQVYAKQVEGTFSVLQTLAQSDFGASCDQADGFGYSMSFADGVLAIGAPGKLDSALNAGAVFLYAGQADGFQPITALSGTGESSNSAWGTRVETDGQVLLVQGNELGAQVTQQGLANPRTLNLFINQPSGWQLAQAFSDAEPSLFAQDFIIDDDWLFINQHTFIEDQECSFGDGNFSGTSSLYTTTVTGYQRAEDSEQFANVTQIALSNSTPSQSVTPEFDQLIDQSSAQGSEAIIRLLVYAGFQDCGSFNRGLVERLVQYTLGDDNTLLETGDFIINESLDILQNEEDQRTEFPTINGLSADNEFILGVDINRQGQPFISINRPFSVLNSQGRLILRSEVLREELLLGALEQDFFLNASLQINTSANLAALTSDADRVNRVAVHERVTALDPAITQAWWFGPAFDGQGITFEVLSNNRLLMHWFTYDLAGNQAWIRGVGRMVDGEVNLELVRGMGPSFTFGAFDPDDRRPEPWGQASIQFDGCTSGTMRYDSPEFGAGELPLMPLTNNNLGCGTGILPPSSVNRSDAPLIAGSFFDPDRAGEGIILMPIPSAPEPIVINESTRFGFDTRARVVAIWLTYTPTGEQAWYYMGIYEMCNDLPLPTSRTCVLQASSQPRSTTGPVFGPGYNPNARVSRPWGIASPFQSDFAPDAGRLMLTFPSPLILPVANPHGTGVLQLQQATLPIGYEPLLD